MKRIVFATSNEGKMDEIRSILKDLKVELVSLKDLGMDVEIEENGATFEENAIIKAEAIMKLTNELVLADDSGLEVDYLDKAPGVYSARFMGEATPYRVKNQYIIDRLSGLQQEDRRARFVCVIACAYPGRETIVSRGTIEGYIAEEICGEHGFGYDPIFYVPEFGCTTAQMSAEQKNNISHRGIALSKMKEILKQYL